MGPKTRRELVETALGDAEDNEHFLRRVRERMDGYTLRTPCCLKRHQYTRALIEASGTVLIEAPASTSSIPMSSVL